MSKRARALLLGAAAFLAAAGAQAGANQAAAEKAAAAVLRVPVRVSFVTNPRGIIPAEVQARVIVDKLGSFGLKPSGKELKPSPDAKAGGYRYVVEGTMPKGKIQEARDQNIDGIKKIAVLKKSARKIIAGAENFDGRGTSNKEAGSVDAAAAGPKSSKALTLGRPQKRGEPKDFSPVTKQTAAKLLGIFHALASRGFPGVRWGKLPMGELFVRVPVADIALSRESYAAMVPVGAFAPKAKPQDPNKASYFLIERSDADSGKRSYSNEIPLPQPTARKLAAAPVPAPYSNPRLYVNSARAAARRAAGGSEVRLLSARADSQDASYAWRYDFFAPSRLFSGNLITVNVDSRGNAAIAQKLSALKWLVRGGINLDSLKIPLSEALQTASREKFAFLAVSIDQDYDGRPVYRFYGGAPDYQQLLVNANTGEIEKQAPQADKNR